jgi:sporulation protein YlmC with PRC-barrel domain
MRKDAELPATSALSYLDSSKVMSPAGALSELDVLSADGRRVGKIEGVVIDAAARRVRYLTVRSSGWLGRKRYLLQADQLGQLEGDRKALRLRADLHTDETDGPDPATLHEFSDDDLMAALFPPQWNQPAATPMA